MKEEIIGSIFGIPVRLVKKFSKGTVPIEKAYTLLPKLVGEKTAKEIEDKLNLTLKRNGRN